MYERLTSLAKDPSPACRAALLLGLTDLMAALDGDAGVEIAAIYTDIVLGVLPTIAPQERGELSARLADMAHAPANLIRQLAAGEIEVAGPLLRRSPALDDDMLAALAATLPLDHLLAIAARTRVSERVSDALIARCDRSVLRALAQNHGAQFSPTGLNRLIEEASMVLATASVGTRGEVVAFVARPRSRDAARPGPFGPAQIVPMPSRPMPEADPSHAGGLTPCEGNPIAAVIATIASGDRMLEVAALLAEAAGLPADRVSRLIARSDPMPLAILCKAAGVATDTFALIAALHGRRFGRKSSHVFRLVESYSDMEAAEARRTLRFLTQRPSEAAAPPA